MKDYKYIRAWGQMHRLPQAFTDAQIACARADKAPPNSVYVEDDEPRRWMTFDGLAKDTQLSITYYLGYYGDESDYPLGEPNPPFRERDARDRD